MKRVNERLEDGREDGGIDPVPVDIALTPPTRVLVITGPNTGGKTVAHQDCGLLALDGAVRPARPRRQGIEAAGLQVGLLPTSATSKSISASLSTFSAHITNVVAMDRR
jgi:DNA mismatch repair protein MutS2